MTRKKLTGTKVLLIAAAAFGVILTANLVLAVSAVRTFPGLVVGNVYVASQEFDRRRAAQEMLDWQFRAHYGDAGLVLDLAGESARNAVASITASIGRPTHVQDDRPLELRPTASGFAAPVTLAPGQWLITLEALAVNGTRFSQRLPIFVAKQ